MSLIVLRLPENMFASVFALVSESMDSFDVMLPFLPLLAPRVPSFMSTPVTAKISLGWTELRLRTDPGIMKIRLELCREIYFIVRKDTTVDV